MMMAEQYPSDSWWLFLFVLVVILCVLGILKAVDQRNERLQWRNYVDEELRSHELTMSDLVSDVDGLLSRERSYATKTMLQDAVSSLDVKLSQPPQPEYRHIAGCYGILPKDSRWFNLTCDKDFPEFGTGD